MNKTELIDSMSAKSGLTKAESKKALESFLETTVESLKNGDKVSLVGWGTLQVNRREERKGRNPQNGKEITISAKNVVKFKAGSEFDSSVN